jgi:hypothetical protein
MRSAAANRSNLPTISCNAFPASAVARCALPAASRWPKRPADLLAALCDAGYSVSLETSGALDIGGVDARVSRIVDLKAPGSGESKRRTAGRTSTC